MLPRIALFALVILVASCNRHSPYASLIDYGLYDADVLVEGNWKLGFPVKIESVHGIQHRKTTLSIPCQDGRYWGFRAHLSNPTKDRPIHFKYEIKHPEFTSPDGKRSSGDMHEFQLQPGESRDLEFFWFFLDSCPFEFVPGDWTMVLSAEGKEVISRTFTMYKP
jgi:hypothetical protein